MTVEISVADGGRTLAEVWADRPPDATHHLVLDGAGRLSPALRRQAALAAARFPDAAVSFYAGWDEPNGSAVRLAAAGGCAWVEGIQFDRVSTAAVLLPARHAAGLAAFAAVPDRPDHGAVLHDYLQLAGLALYLSVPSFVDAGGRAAWFAVGDRVTDGAVLAGYAHCPYFFRGLAYGMNRYGDGWCHEHWTVVARRAGLDPEAVLAGAPSGAPTFVRSLWVTAFLTGFVAHGGPPAGAPLLDTLIDGGRHGSVLGAAEVERRRGDLRAVARAGYDAGAAG